LREEYLGDLLVDSLEALQSVTDRHHTLLRAAGSLLGSRRFRATNAIVERIRSLARRTAPFPPVQVINEVGQQRVASPTLIEPWPRPALGSVQDAPTDLRVTYLLPDVRVSGGVFGAAQLVNELRLLGADARIAALRERPAVYGWGRFLDEPMTFASVADLVENMPPCDLAVATHYKTATWADQLVRRGRAAHSVSFLQDYEAWFMPESDVRGREQVTRSYELIPHKIVKSDWLASLLKNDGYETRKIPLGLDLRFFHPRQCERPTHPVVVAMARPRTPRRGFESVVAALEMVRKEVPTVEIILFGEDLMSRQLPFAYRGEGEVADHDRLATLYSYADVHLDGSDFQAFGRPALEAMACGTVSVLTDAGGVTEYARHEVNCLLVPPKDPTAFAEAMVRLLQDEPLRGRLRAGGLETVMGYCSKREARDTLAYFHEIVD
jgi:hypothetical protein